MSDQEMHSRPKNRETILLERGISRNIRAEKAHAAVSFYYVDEPGESGELFVILPNELLEQIPEEFDL